MDSHPEHNQYELDILTVPRVEDHRFGNPGVEVIIKQFWKEVEEEVRRDLYLRIR